jgi:uroporphyrin-III C-methyltransferase
MPRDTHADASGQPVVRPGRVDFVGAGPGDPELLTLKALRLLGEADAVVHDRLIAPAILALIPQGTRRIDAGKEGFGPSVPQSAINTRLVALAHEGLKVVRLKAGDPGIFGRLDEEVEAVEAAGLPFTVVPGITAAAAAAAGLGLGLTRRGRNTGVRLVTGHDARGFADQDWRALARPGEVAAIYMGKRAARFLTGRLMMHGARPDTPVTVVENASRPDARTLSTTLAALPDALDAGAVQGPAVILLGIAPRGARAVLEDIREEIAL